MDRLPVSGAVVSLRLPTGADDLLLLEQSGSDPEVALSLISRLARTEPPVDWASLPVPDLEALMLRIRQMALGDRIQCDLRCRAPGCRARVDLSFSIDAYLEHRRPGARRGAVEPAEEPGWYRLRGEDIQFRLPRASDQIRGDGNPAELRTVCVRPAKSPARLIRRVEAALDAMAPILSGQLDASCAECGRVTPVYFDVLGFVLAELRSEAAFIYEDVRTLAMKFHWQEPAILEMPAKRRARYVELAEESERI